MKTRQAALWMAAFSVVTLGLGVAREFVIARGLQASGDADHFFQGLVVVGAARGFSLSLLRARWIVVGPGHTASELLRGQGKGMAWICAVGLLALLGFTDAARWLEPSTAAFACAVVLATVGSALRALAERAGYERRGFVVEWALPLGTIAGAIAVGRGALGPALGIAAGLAVGIAILGPAVLSSKAPAPEHGVADDPSRTRYLLIDTLAYVNLGLLDGGLSSRIYDTGQYAVLNYAYLFVNAALAVPTTAATVLALRIAARGGDAAQVLRRWAALGGLIVGVVVAAVYGALGLPWVAGLVDEAAGWGLAASIQPVVLAAIPFAALRLANTIGRQHRVATDPRRLVPWDLAGLAGRTVLLVILAARWGAVASPLALAFAELVQLGGWLRRGRSR